MLIFVYGQDTFRVHEKVAEMTKRFAEKFDPAGLNLAQFAAGAPIGEVMQAVSSPPFLGAKRMAVVRNLVSTIKKAEAQPWIDGFLKTPDSTIVIFWETAEPEKVEKTELFKALKKTGEAHYYPFPELEGAPLKKWIVDRVQALGAAIERDAVQELVNRVGADLWRMNGELQKLVAFKSAAGVAISKNDVAQMVAPNFDDQMFAFIDAVSRQDVQGALRLLDEERQSGAEESHLLAMLTRQVRILLSARSLLDQNPRATKQELAQAMSLHPFVAQKSLEQAKRLTLPNLKAAHQALYQFDRRLKLGKIDPATAVDLTVTRLLG